MKIRANRADAKVEHERLANTRGKRLAEHAENAGKAEIKPEILRHSAYSAGNGK